MHWYAVHGGTVLSDVVDWFQDTAVGYGTTPSGTGWAKIKS